MIQGEKPFHSNVCIKTAHLPSFRENLLDKTVKNSNICSVHSFFLTKNDSKQIQFHSFFLNFVKSSYRIFLKLKIILYEGFDREVQQDNETKNNEFVPE